MARIVLFLLQFRSQFRMQKKVPLATNQIYFRTLQRVPIIPTQLMTYAAAVISVVLWAVLLTGRGSFWRCRITDGAQPTRPAKWPSVAVVVPARNEAEVIRESLRSLLAQDYRGRLSLIVVDDNSSDGTAALAREAARGQVRERDLSIISGAPLPSGWTGKLWAVRQGVATAEANVTPDYLLLTDADITHAPDTVSWLIAQAISGDFVLTSLMAKLRCVSLAERSLVPAFIYFFQMVFPFAWVARPNHATAAAAGGCVLVRSDALRLSGGMDGIRDALIDDCALAQQLKSVGPIWLGLTERVRSLRPYPRFADIKAMVSRSAYAQLGYSPWLLAGTCLGMLLTFLVPPLLAVFASGVPRLAGVVVWIAMAISFQPTLQLYRVSPLWGIALPGIALLYTYYTLHSAYQYLRKRGGAWKGRVYAGAAGL